MSRKLGFIPPNFTSYADIKREMERDFQYRMESRTDKTAFGRPLYQRINVQMVITQACPYSCSFCLERQNPQGAKQNFPRQIEALRAVLQEHPNARITITGGEPCLFFDHIREIVDIAKPTATFITINTTGAFEIPSDIECHINVSDNAEVHNDLSVFEGREDVTIQTIFPDKEMNIQNIKRYMDEHPHHKNFSFRYLTEIGKDEYDMSILDELRNDSEIEISTFRVGDFFMYIIGNYNGHHFRVTLGDMTLQQSRKYDGAYSNIIINPEGDILLNWNNANSASSEVVKLG